MSEDRPLTHVRRAAEQLRQERRAFAQRCVHEARWFHLRLIMGYASIVVLSLVMVVAVYVVLNEGGFTPDTVESAVWMLFADVVGLCVTVWKVILSRHFYRNLKPVTRC